MAEYYLRMDGVNLANFVLDTQSLNIIRGGGLLLLDAVSRVKKATHAGHTLDPVSTGASSGLFHFTAPDDDAACKVREGVIALLRQDDDLRHATIMVEVLPAEPDGAFLPTREKLLAVNRWRQMQAPSLAIPPGTGQEVCGFDLVRPARAVARGPQGKPIGESSWRRHEFGRTMKQDFYAQWSGLPEEKLPGFTNEFATLANGAGFGNLNGKMAVFYVDGNGFGKLQQQHCTSRVTQKGFDDFIQGKRQELLRTLLQECMADSDWMHFAELRLETLLWGGDEIIWVAPAWKGWWLAERFFALSAGWQYQGTDAEGTQFCETLTHAGGLVFCHDKAPIHRITRLVRDLAEIAKGVSRTRNLLAYQVLESFDHLGADPARWRQSQCPPGVTADALLVAGENLATIAAQAGEVRRALPRRRLYAIVTALFDNSAETDDLIAEARAVVERAGGLASLDAVLAAFGGGRAAWLHLLELWDYLDPERTP
ncbi:MAG: hypothetical protein BWK76_09880 [Desulfobulbaceae bacterium A2]|nr:MAG: hypothetical protein BWK76_09880 [Desulfobulbaceae bacterium A2]